MGYQKAILSALMMYDYDETVFDGFRVPEGMDRTTTLQNLLMETSEMSVIYPSINALRMAVTVWTNKNFMVWSELYKTLFYKYNPIHNYNRKEELIETHTGDTKEIRDTSTTTDYTRDLHETVENDSNDKVAAFNNGLTDSETSHDYSSSAQTGSQNETKRDEGTITNDRDLTDMHLMHAYGNIGVTTTQDMIEAQREVVQFNMIDYITNDFKKHFCVMVS